MPRFNFTNITSQSRVSIADIMNNFNEIETNGITEAEVNSKVDTLNNTITNLDTRLSRLATTSINGLMSSTDKSKLNGIAENANNYTLPTASSTLGGVKTTSSVTSNSGYTACPIISGVPYYKDTNTTYSAATTSANGLMTAAMVSKLNGIATGANATTIVDNLTSDSATSALSAKQGKALKTLVDAKQKTITRGTAAPSGGSNGDYYIQYFD